MQPSWVIITKTGKPLVSETGKVVLFPSVREASYWMAPTDLSVERREALALKLAA